MPRAVLTTVCEKAAVAIATDNTTARSLNRLACIDFLHNPGSRPGPEIACIHGNTDWARDVVKSRSNGVKFCQQWRSQVSAVLGRKMQPVTLKRFQPWQSFPKGYSPRFPPHLFLRFCPDCHYNVSARLSRAGGKIDCVSWGSRVAILASTWATSPCCKSQSPA